MKTNKYILTLALTVCCALGNLYAITSSYYSSIDGKSGTELFNAIHTVSKKGYSSLSYAGLWTAYQTTDVYPTGHANAGKIWDMYGNCTFTYSSNQCGSYKNECDCYNREHSIPKSWFGGTENSDTPGSDLFHVVPTDGKVNGIRSNYAFGEVNAATYTYAGSKLGSKKSITIENSILNASGSSTQTCSSTPVFEPVDEYKGDFARGYLGTMIRWANGDYQTFTTDQGASIFNTAYDAAHYYGLTAYGVALLLKWHRQDPVSQKEIDRNNGIQTKQGNRNPFIDYPCLVEYIWGNKAGETVNLSELTGTFTGSWTTGDGCPCGDVPAITLPTGDIFVGSTEVGTPVSKTITVQGVNLEANLTLAVSGANSSLFSLNATTILKAAAEAGTTVTITYTPTSAGSHSAVLTISGGGLASNRTFNLSGTCCNPYTVTYSRNGITEQVGACGTFTLPTAEDEEDACDGWEFQGWVTSSTPFSEGQTSAPTFVTEVSGATTLYAVYGKAEASGAPRRATMADTWTKVTDASTLKSGDVLVIASCDNSATAGDISSQIMASVSSTFSSDKSTITSLGSGTVELTLGGSSGAWTLSSTSGALGATAAKKLAWGSGTTTWSISISSGDATITNGTSSYGSMQYNTQSPRFTTYTSGQAAVQLYRKEGGSSSTTTYKKLPCTTYTISYADAGGVATGGTYSANVATALAGTTISLDYDEAMGYEFTGWTVTNASTSATITVSNGQFTMPEANVTVQASFTALCSKLSAPDVTAVAGDGQITLTWEDVTDADHYTVSIGTGAGYTTECGGEATGMNTITHSGTTNTCVISGLTNGLAYTTSVVANGISSVCDSDADEDTTTPTAEIPTEVTVTFNANGGEGTMSDQTIPYNTATALDANAFTRTGYTFQGWATVQGGGKVYDDGASVTLTEDITLYAVWQINRHSVTFDQPATGGTFTVNGSDSSPITNVDFESTVTIAITPTNSHFTVNTVTVSGASGDVAVSGEGNTRTFTMPDEDVTVAVTMTEDPKYTVNWYVNGTPTPETNYADEALEGVADPSIECNDKVFQGWTSHNDYDSDDAPDDLFTSVADMTMPVGGANYYAVFATVETETTGGGISSVEDEITLAMTGASGTTYSDWSGKTSNSSAVYAGNNAGGNSSIQLRTNSSNSGVVSTTSGGKITKVVIDWNENTASGRKVDVYGSNTAYTAAANLYGDAKGTLLGTLSYTSTGSKDTELTVSGDYEYVGLRSQSGALYLNSVNFTWSTGAESTTTTTISGYTTSCAAPEYYNVSFTPTMTGATITVNGQSTSPQSVELGATVSIAISPDAAHTVSGVSVTGGVTPSGSGNDWSFTMPASDVTVTVTLADVPAHTVTWSANGVTTTEQYYEGQAIAFPVTATGCDGKEFTGWSAETVAETDIAPSYVTEATMGTSDLTYYAVFAEITDASVTATFDPATASGLTESPTKTWTHDATGVKMQLVGSSSRYTSGTPNTWTMSHSSGSKTVITSPTNITQIVIRSVYQYKSGNNTYNGWINDASVGTLSPTTFTSAESDGYVTQTISDINAKSVTIQDNSSSNGNQARVILLTVTCGSTTYTGYTTSCTTPEEVTVTFNANDGSDVPATATQTIPYNEETALDANTFSRTGYHFTGWNTATDGSGAAYTDEAEVTLTKDMTLYAQWAKNSYNVIFTPSITGQATITVNGASTSPQTVAFESAVTIAVTTDVAYAVDEVSVVDGEDEPVSVTNNGDGTYTFTMPASAVTVTVTLTAQPLYTIRFIDNGAVISTQEVFNGQSADAPSDPTPCEGYAFAGWWDAPLTTPTTTAETWITDFTASANQDYYAVYSYSEESEGAPRRAKMEDEEYTLYSGALAEGDYIIYYDGKAMKATVTSGRLDYAEITPVNDKITSPDVSIVWHIAANGDYWTIYNADVEKYAAGTGVKNKAQLLADGTDDKALWTASGTETYDFVNKANAAAEVNATLRENGTYGYACYAAGTGGSLSLYKKSSSGGGGGGTTTTTYYTTAPDCEPEVTPADMMIVAEYGGARIALTHNNEYTSFGATPMMFVGGKYYYPDSESAATPVIADMTWQVTEMDGEGYTIKAGEQYLAPNEGAITLSDKSYLWPTNEDGAISYDAVHQTFVVGGEGSLLPKIHVVPVPKADDIQLTKLHSDRTLTPKRFGTLCLPHAVALPFAWGVKVYSVAGAARDDSGNLKGICLEEEREMLEAGKPYLIEPVDEKNISTMQMWYAEGMDYVTKPVDAIAMVGNLSTEPLRVDSGYYVLSQNQLRKVAIDNQTIGQYKAYFDLNDLEDPAASLQAHAYRVMYVEGGEQVVTDLSQTPGGINWNEPVYNILGMRVDRNATGVLIQGGVKFIIRVP